jgi:hypothetical protein
MVLLLVLVLSVSTVIRVESRASGTSKSMLTARQNALLGLDVAISQLQEYAGKDQAVTFPATTAYPSTNSTMPAKDPLTTDANCVWKMFEDAAATSSDRGGSTLPTNSYPETWLNTNSERGIFETKITNWWSTRNPRWTGILDASLRSNSATTPNQYGEPKRNQIPVWLVSGNEKYVVNQSNSTIKDSAGNDATALYLTPNTALNDPAIDPTIVYLVNTGSAATNSSDGLDGRVKAKKQAIVMTNATGGSVTNGYYAYWVGDESTKANFSVRDQTSVDDTTYPHDVPANNVTNYYRLQVPQRIGWENMTNFNTATFSPNDRRLMDISTTKEIALLEQRNTPTISDACKTNFHNITAFSKGLLTDVSLGGLKKDLTVFFEGSGGPSANSTIMNQALYSKTDPRLGTGGTIGFPTTTTGLPTWGQLKNWYQNKNQGAGLTVGPGFAPVLANYQLYFAFTYDTAGNIQFHMLPVVALWNPYDTPLASTSYTLKWRHNFVSCFGTAVASPGYTDPTPADDPQGWADGKMTNGYLLSPLYGISWYDPGNPNYKKVGMNLPTFGTATRPNLYSTGWPYGGTNSWEVGLGGPGHKFSPFDKASSDTLLPPDTPINAQFNNPTWVNYTFTTGFAAGEVKIFTVAKNPDGTLQNPDPIALHKGTTTVAMANDFNATYPVSYWFNIAGGLVKGTTTGGSNSTAPPSAGDDVRVFCDPLAPISPSFSSMILSCPGGTLWTNYYLGSPGDWSAAARPNSINGNDPRTWKKLYDFNTWQNTPIPTDTRTVASPICAMYRGWLQPFTANNCYATTPTPHFASADLNNHFRAFAIMNLSASSLDPIKQLELAREPQNIENNSDKFGMQSLFYTPQPPANIPWNSSQATYDPNTRSWRGYALMAWNNSGAFDNPYFYRNYIWDDLLEKPLSVLPLRRAFNPLSKLLSIGQFQNANLSPYCWQPGFAVGNSEASPYVDRARIAGLESYSVGYNKFGNAAWQPAPRVAASTFPNDTNNSFVDMSYLLNENLWDHYFLSSIPQSGAIALDNSTPLANSRHRFRTEAAPTASAVRDYDNAAAYLFNMGAFNVNSTSVEAWKALLTAFRNLTLQSPSGSSTAANPAATMPVVKSVAPLGDRVDFTFNAANNVLADYGAVATSKDYTKLLNGFRYLTDTMIQRLAERIVDEVRLRGPFLSLADFVNRRLVAPYQYNITTSAWYKARTLNVTPAGNWDQNYGSLITAYNPFAGLTGINGAIQRAINVSGINGGMNYPVPDNPFDRAYWVYKDPNSAAATGNRYAMQIYPALAWYLDTEHLAGVPVGEAGQLLSHAPGFVSQGDILSMIGPALTVRGDTFLIRTYGDAVDASGRVTARAYLEAVVQRIPEPVTPAGTTGSSRWQPNDSFGRKFKVVKLRWLNPDDV